jgi:hypothetical protein
MAWRKWLVRGLVFSVLGGLLAAGLLYQAWTHPATVRRLVMEKLGVRFLDVTVGLESARLRLLGGIVVHDLRMARSNGLDHGDFLYIPTAVIYHDKEHLLDGKLSIRKLELDRPQIKLVRLRDGSFNLKGLLGPVDLSERLPTVVMRHATINFEDHTNPPGGTVLEVRDVGLTIINDPLDTLLIEGSGQTDVLGPVQIRGSVSRADFSAQIHVEMSAIPVGPDLVQRLSVLCPEPASHLRLLQGTGKLEADLAYHPGTPSPLRHEVRLTLQQGQLSHARLPLPLTQLEVSAHLVDGVIPHAHATARAGSARVELTLDDLTLASSPSGTGEIPDLQDLVRGLDLRIEHLPVTPELLAHLPDSFRWIGEDYAPVGLCTITHTFRRAGPRPLQRRWVVQPESARSECAYFRYPVEQVHGTIEVDAAGAPQLDVSLDLAGKAGGQPITVRGWVRGRRGRPGIHIDVRGQRLPLDHRLMRALEALKDNNHQIVRQFLPDHCRGGGLRRCAMGQADYLAAIRRADGQPRMRNVFTITFRDCAVKYDLFPYPLEKVDGVLVIRPDHWECRAFHGCHAGGEIFVDGHSEPLPPRPGVIEDSPQQSVYVFIRGRGINLDDDFAQALAPPGLKDRRALVNAWQTLALAGQMNFAARVVDHPRAPQDLDVGVEIRGCTMKPTFFPYALTDLSGAVRYVGGRVYLRNVNARHGGATLGLKSGLLQLKPGGGFVAWLEGIRGQQLLPNGDFLEALPEPLRKGLAPLRLKDPLDVQTSLTVDAAPVPGGPLKVWWDGGATLRNASLRAGVQATQVNGQVSCRGHHDGRHVCGLIGDLLLTQARVLGQPVSNVHGRVEILPDSPDVLRLRDFKLDLFGGTIGGQARLEVGPVLRYDLLLEGVGIGLEQFGRHNLGADAQAQLEGPARAALHLMGEGTDLLGLKGNGRLDVNNGKMGRLPLLLDLLKAFGLRMPDRTAFEQAHMTFAIEGPRVRVEQLDLYGNAVSLRGAGSVDLDGSNVNLDFSATPGRVTQVLPSGIDAIPQAISGQLLKIKVRGKLGKGDGVRFEKLFLPAVSEPFKRAIGP